MLGARRLAGVVVEVRLALPLDGNDPYIHHVAAVVLAAQRKLDDAWAHCLVALERPLATPEAHLLGAQIRTLQGEVAHAKELLEEALKLDPAHTGALTRLAGLFLDAGDRAAASRLVALGF